MLLKIFVKNLYPKRKPNVIPTASVSWTRSTELTRLLDRTHFIRVLNEIFVSDTEALESMLKTTHVRFHIIDTIRPVFESHLPILINNSTAAAIIRRELYERNRTSKARLSPRTFHDSLD